MANHINITEEQIGKNWKLFYKVHKLIMASSKEIAPRLFPIYVKYSLGDDVLAIIFFKGIYAKGESIDLGLNIKSKKIPEGLKDAKYMKDRNATYSILVSEINFDKNKITNFIELTK